jgi:hypothetical protein
MRKQTVLMLFNSSDYAPAPWLQDGRYNVVSVDYDDTDHSRTERTQGAHGDHYRLNIDLSSPRAVPHVFDALAVRQLPMPVFVLSFAPCTDLAVAGAKHFASKLSRDPDCQRRAIVAAQLAREFGCAYMVENPVSILATAWRKPTGYVQPWHFANQVEPSVHPEFPDIIPPNDLYTKKTGLWCGNGAEMPEQSWFHEPPERVFPGWSKLGGKSARTKYIRSLTPRGMAHAIYVANRAPFEVGTPIGI